MKWNSKLIRHNNESRIGVYFEKNPILIARIKKLEGSRWSQTLSVWHLPDTEENRIKFKLPLAATSLPNEEGIAALAQLKNYKVVAKTI